MSAGPWYHNVVVDEDYIYKDVRCVIKFSHEWKTLMKISQRLPYLILDIGFLHSSINKCIVPYELGGWASIRGYTSIRNDLIKNVKDKIIVYTEVKALRVLSNSNIFQNWRNHVLYRPNSIRYGLLKKEFERLAC
jgi:hypothetical protein